MGQPGTTPTGTAVNPMAATACYLTEIMDGMTPPVLPHTIPSARYRNGHKNS